MKGWFKTMQRSYDPNGKSPREKPSLGGMYQPQYSAPVIMPYDEMLRAPRSFRVDYAPQFTATLKGDILCTQGTETVKIFSANGQHLETLHSEFSQSTLTGLAVNSSENSLFVCDARGNQHSRVQIFNIEGNEIMPVCYIGEGLFQAPHGVTTTRDHVTLVTDVKRKQVFIVQKDGYHASVFGDAGTHLGLFSFPHDVAFDEVHRRIVVSDTLNRRVQIFDEHGIYIDVIEFAEDGLPLFSFPTSLSFDHVGNLLVVDNGADMLFVFTPSEFRLHRTFDLRRMDVKKPSSVSLLPFERLCITSSLQKSICVI